MILLRHITLEFLRNMLSSLLVIGFILFVGRSIKLLREGFDLLLLLQMAIYILPYILTFVIPISLITASVLTYGRLASDNEVTTIRASGINLWSTTKYIWIIAILCSAITYHLADQVLPKARFELLKIVRNSAIHLLNNRINSGDKIIQFSDFLISFGSRDSKKQILNAVVIQKFKDSNLSQQIEASWAKLPTVNNQDIVSMDLYNGQMTNFERQSAPLRFKGFHFELNPMESNGNTNKSFKDMTSSELWNVIKLKKLKPKQVSKIKYIIYSKLSMACSCLVFIALGIPMGLIGKHSNRIVGFGFALAIVFLLYYPLMLIFRSLGESGTLPAMLCAWSPNIILIILSAYLIKHVHN